MGDSAVLILTPFPRMQAFVSVWPTSRVSISSGAAKLTATDEPVCDSFCS